MPETAPKPETALQKVKRHLKIAGLVSEPVLRGKLQRALASMKPPISLSTRGSGPYEAKWQEVGQPDASAFGTTADAAAIHAAAELFESPRGAEILAAVAGKVS